MSYLLVLDTAGVEACPLVQLQLVVLLLHHLVLTSRGLDLWTTSLTITITCKRLMIRVYANYFYRYLFIKNIPVV